MIYQPEKFADIPLNNSLSGPCSPILDGDRLGLLISAPEIITFAETAVLPVCGRYRFYARFFNQFHMLSNEIVLVAVDAERHVPYIGNMHDPEYESAPGKFSETDTGFEEKIVGGWFNYNLYSILEGLPHHSATYLVYAMIGDIKSNLIKVKLKKQ
jgi:hypothetical protein